MSRVIGGTLVALAVVASVAANPGRSSTAANVARFDWFEYTGHDSIYDTHRAGANDYLNPILAGFYPDPSITRARRRLLSRQLDLRVFPGHSGLSQQGSRELDADRARPRSAVAAASSTASACRAACLRRRSRITPARSTSMNTCVDCGGNFLVTAKNPAGPWSDPDLAAEFDGIDPSIFFDDDGKAYVVNNGPPIGTPLYSGHRAIWIQEFDLATKKLIGAAHADRQRRRRSSRRSRSGSRPAHLQARRAVLSDLRRGRDRPITIPRSCSAPTTCADRSRRGPAIRFSPSGTSIAIAPTRSPRPATPISSRRRRARRGRCSSALARTRTTRTTPGVRHSSCA